MVLADISIWTVNVCLGFFGADSPKVIRLWSNRRAIGRLPSMAPRRWAPASSGIVSKSIDANGVQRVTGASGLKGTQEYPLIFGEHPNLI